MIETLETFTNSSYDLVAHVLVRVGATGFAIATAIRQPERHRPGQLHPLKTGNYYRTLLEHRLPVDDQLILQFMSEGGDRDASTSFKTGTNRSSPPCSACRGMIHTNDDSNNKDLVSTPRLKADESVKTFDDFSASVRPITRH